MEEVCVGALAALAVAAVGVTAATALGDKIRSKVREARGKLLNIRKK